MIKCEYPQHNTCRNRNNCLLTYGNNYTTKLSKNITYYLQQLEQLYKDRKLYENTLKDIQKGKYTTTHAQYTKIPTLNALNNPILKPYDIYHNLKLDRIEKEIKVTKKTINELRKEEYKIIKTLKRQKRRHKTYGIS